MTAATQILYRQETQTRYPNIFKRGVVALVVFSKHGRMYQSGERVDGSMTKAVQIPAVVGDDAPPQVSTLNTTC